MTLLFPPSPGRAWANRIAAQQKRKVGEDEAVQATPRRRRKKKRAAVVTAASRGDQPKVQAQRKRRRRRRRRRRLQLGCWLVGLESLWRCARPACFTRAMPAAPTRAKCHAPRLWLSLRMAGVEPWGLFGWACWRRDPTRTGRPGGRAGGRTENTKGRCVRGGRTEASCSGGVVCCCQRR